VRAKGDPLRSGSTYASKIDHPSSESTLLAGREAKRIVMNDAEGLRRRAENLLALATKARDDNYTQLAGYILDRADLLFEEVRILAQRATALTRNSLGVLVPK
jgi:hypothetical protein